MEYIISDCVKVWEKNKPIKSYWAIPFDGFEQFHSEITLAEMFGYNTTRIWIKDKWYDVLPPSQVVRSPSSVDGKYHFIYIQINMTTHEYYIGKVNRKRWSELKRYNGSGLLFRRKYKGHETDFVRYFIACCSTEKETEELESQIVDEQLLSDPKCLNLVRGGGGTSEHDSSEKRSARQREIMKEHPENYQAMIEASQRLFRSGDTYALKQRAEKTKATMSNDFYRTQMSERIKRWRKEHPEEYAQSRENNKKANQSPESKEKRRKSRKKWIAEHPEEHKAQQERLSELRNSSEARKKRSESLRIWAEEHPEEAKEHVKRRSAASVEKCRKPVNMCDLETGEVLRTFKSQHEAAQWLVDNGLAKNTHCASSISAVCQRKPCTTGYGYRKKAYGYDWQYADKD